MAAVWLGIPLTILLVVGSLYTCFAWSKNPRRRHVVIMDKKPVLPNDEVVITNTVSEKYPGSPDRLLYAANCTPSPSELEWEHAWDFLTNSDFDVLSKKQLHGHFRRQLINQKLLSPDKKTFEEDHSRKETPSNDKTGSSEQAVDSSNFCFQWKHQDDSEWSKDRIKCLGKGLLDVSNEHTQPSLSEICPENSEQESIIESALSIDTFSPLGMSSPHSLSFEEVAYINQSRLQKNKYLQISFDAATPSISSDENCDTSRSDSGNSFHKEEKDENVDSGLEMNSSISSSENEMFPVKEGPTHNPFQFEDDMLFGIYDDVYKTTLFDVVEVDLISPQTACQSTTTPVVYTMNHTENDSVKPLEISCISSKNNFSVTCDKECCQFALDLLFYECCDDAIEQDIQLETVESKNNVFSELLNWSTSIGSNDESSTCFQEVKMCKDVESYHLNSALKKEPCIELPEKIDNSPLFTSTPTSPRSPPSSKYSPWKIGNSPTRTPVYTRPIPKSPVLSRVPSLPSICENSPVKSKFISQTLTSKRIPPSLMSKTTVLPSGCRVLRVTKENKQTALSSTVRPQTPHMKSYIALRQQCRRNDSLREHFMNSASRRPRTRKVSESSEISSQTTRKLPVRIQRTSSIKTKQRVLAAKKIYQKVMPLDQESKSTSDKIMSTEDNARNLSWSGNLKTFMEKKMFIGHLRRWECEDLIKVL